MRLRNSPKIMELEKQGICDCSDADAMTDTSTIVSDGKPSNKEQIEIETTECSTQKVSDGKSFDEEQIEIETTECSSAQESVTLKDPIDVPDWLNSVVEPTRSTSSQSDKGRDIIRPPIPPNEDSSEQPPQEIADRLRQRFKRRKWMDSELKALEKGMKKYTEERLIWVHILNDETYGPTLKDRSPTDLKDKARNEKKKRTREGRSIGIFQIASG
ncbi:27685_t:CDS:2 [Dentiscutata erythropus]|uniref:27685_t:CDS:1 n=1 Tax=Dentiscutata erythropus TaxID=1348616 RepID=A0A9N9CYB3_9GLOM|nr:27685_t:CDS:2 [Dentiscutata erythropus]